MAASGEGHDGSWEARTGPDNRTWTVAPTPDDEYASRECWFCGMSLIGGNRAKEHVFPQWLVNARDARRRSFSVDWRAPVDEDVLDARRMTVAGHVAGSVCRECNGGWMSRLEGANKETILDLARGLRQLDGLRDPTETGGLARWAVKTAFAAQATAIGPKLIPRKHRRLLAAGGLPPVTVIARRSPVDVGFGWRGSQDWLVDRPAGTRGETAALVGRSYKLVVTVGHLVLAVAHWPDPRWSMLVSGISHRVLITTELDCLTYPNAADRHGMPLIQATEIMGMTAYVRVVHPALHASGGAV